MTTDPRRGFALRVPAEPGQVATVRLFAAAVARSLDADDEVVEDLKLAVTELVTAVVVAGDRGTVEVTATPGAGSVDFVVGPLRPGDLVDGAIDPVDIVVALFPDTARDPDSTTVRLRVPLTSP